MRFSFFVRRQWTGRSRTLAAALVAVAVLLCPTAARAQDAAPVASDDPFELGVERTREGRFDEALRAFLAAAAGGDDSARLQFNLGVVYYRLARYPDARAAFARAEVDPEMAELSAYNLGLVALAAGDRPLAARHFRAVAQTARSPSLRALAARALVTADGGRVVPASASLSVLRGRDSNVVVPVGAVGDVPTSIEDDFWEARAGWAVPLDGLLPGLGYRLSGVAIEYDEVGEGDLAYAEGGVEWRGPVSIALGASGFSVGDRGYQTSTDLRLARTMFEGETVRVVYEAAQSWLSARQDRARPLDGSRFAIGATFDVRQSALLWTVGLRRTINDRRAADFSPNQSAVTLRLRFLHGRLATRVWARYTAGFYPTQRQDRLSEFGADAALRVIGPCELVIEATRLDNRSNTPEFSYASERLYAGLRLRF